LHLDREQELALGGEQGPAKEWAMRVLVKLGDNTRSARLVPVSSVHIPDWCGERSSEAWTWLGSTAAKATIPVTANPGGPDDSATLVRMRVLEGLGPHGACSFSCAPYLCGNHPNKGSVVAWGGRAASAFANSVLGARSEVESFETAAASAITGLTPERRMHIEENLQPSVAVVVPRDEGIDHSMLGWALSRRLKDEIPLLCGVRPTFDEAKKLTFALNSRGTVPLFRLQSGVVPPVGMEVMEVDLRSLSQDTAPSPDLVVLGCPHLSEQDINRWSKKLAGRTPSRIEAWFFTSRLCKDKCPVFGAVLRSRGRIYVDRCPLGMREELRGRTIVCDSPAMASCLKESGISAFYAPDQELLSFLTAQ
jgi:predicted aconitase